MKRLEVGSRPFRWLVIAGALWLCWTGEALAQCSITGPSTMCGSAQLCGPTGNYQYQWTGPGGFTSQLACVTVTVPGTYSLRVFDTLNGLWFGPCTHGITSQNAPAGCSIAGPDSVCAGRTAELCGPAGLAEYLWSGPNGFSASSPCVSVGEPGTYGLSVRETPGGCWSSPCERVLNRGSCDPDPPPPTPRGSCPRSARWWDAQCELVEGGQGRFSAEALAAIAGCVDERAAAFSWIDPRFGFCATLGDRDGLRRRARRQYAAALANVCAYTTQAPQNSSRLVGLDPNTEIHLEDLAPMTVADWLAQTDRTLARLERKSQGREARREYRRIICVGWAINHGHGVGPVCGRTGTHLSADESEADAEILDDELAIEDGMPALELEGAAPNPFTLSTRIVYFVATASEPVDIAIYDIGGRRVRSLVSGRVSSGRNEATWDGRSDDGRPVRNGVYFVRGYAGVDQVQSRLTLVR